MRETFGTLLQTAQDLCVDDSTTLPSATTLSDTKTFLNREINRAVRFTVAYLHDHPRTQPLPKTASTVANQQFYHYPSGMDAIETATVTVGSILYPVRIIDSEVQWNNLNQVNFTGFSIPQYIFPRRDDFGLFPIPTAVYTITFNGHYEPKDMTKDDYTGNGSGTVPTVAISQNTTRVTGTNSTFASWMVGAWFKANSDGAWYRIASYTSATAIDLETYFEGSNVSGDNFVIGQSPEIPPELHEYISYKAAASWYAGPRRDRSQAQAMLNYFYTGDFENKSRDPRFCEGGVVKFKNMFRTFGLGNSGLSYRNQEDLQVFDERWRAVLS